MANIKDHVVFSNGLKMPIIGLGTWQAQKEEGKRAIEAALEAGYRHIDTAYNYMNEEVIGEVLNEWISSGKVKRSELFIVTKLPMIGNRAQDVEKFLKKSLAKLQLSYVDLYLIHGPFGLIGKDDNDVFPVDDKGQFVLDKSTDLIGIWKAMEKQVDAGLVKSIGVSNFTSEQIERIIRNARIKPANLQVELHAYFMQKPIREVCNKHNITVCAYAPLGSPGRAFFINSIPDLLTNPIVLELAEKYKKTVAQILLRHLIQHGIVVIPKSSSPQRIVENFQIFDFSLSKSDMDQLDKLDRGKEGRTFGRIGESHGLEDHPEYPYL